MQTFLPILSFGGSAAVLDYRRLGKQRVEAFQLLVANGNEWAINARKSTKPIGKGWQQHPAALMWKGYDEALGLYMNICIAEWIRRGYNNTMKPMPVFNDEMAIFIDGPLLMEQSRLLEYYDSLQSNIELPPWIGNEELHASHRSNLLRKHPEFYKQYNWSEGPERQYVWPTVNERTFQS